MIVAAQRAESGYATGTVHEHDPEDLRTLREAVVRLRDVEERLVL